MSYDGEIKNALQDSNKDYVVWYTGSREQAEYISHYSKYLKGNSLLLPLPDSAAKGNSTEVPKGFLEYFFLDFPDVIISKKDKLDGLPIIGIEILEQKPVGWNHTQRFARAAASAILGVPFAFLMPQKRYMFDKVASASTSQNTYNIAGEMYKENLREEFQLPFSLYKLSDIYQVPCLPFIWPLEEKNKFVCEGLAYNDEPELRWKSLPPGPISKEGKKYDEIENLFTFIDLSIEYFNNNKNMNSLMQEDSVREAMRKIDPKTTTLYTEKHVTLKNPSGGNLKTASIIETKDLIKILNNMKSDYIDALVESESFELIRKKPKTVLIEIDSDPTKGNRGFADPYSGVCASFDYRYCRELTKSSKVNDRDYNLVFAPKDSKAGDFFKKIIKIQTGDGLKFDLSARKTIEDTIEITEKLFEKGPFRLKKELKNIFYFCDLIITPDNLFVGKSFIDK